MADAVSNLILGTTLLNQGPNALEQLLEAQPELLENDEELRGLAIASMALDTHFSLDEFIESGVNEYAAKIILHLKHRPPDYPKIRRQVRKIIEKIGKIRADRFARIAARARQTGTALFGSSEAVMAKARAALKPAQPRDDLANDPKVGDKAFLKGPIIIKALFDRAYMGDSQALLRLIYQVGDRHGYAASLLEQLSDREGTFLVLGSLRRLCYTVFESQHIQAMQAALEKLPEDSNSYGNLNRALNNLRELRPDLFLTNK